MRVGVLVYGRLNKCVEHYDNVMNSIGLHHEIDFFFSSDNAPEVLVNDFIRKYNPILYDNQKIQYDYNLSNFPGKRPETKIHNMTCHFINKNRVFRLFKNHIDTLKKSYDVVIALRIDCVFENKFNLSEISDNTIYIPAGCDFVDNAINDQIAYGNVDTIEKYMSINPLNLLQRRLSIPHPESLTLANIKLNLLKINRVQIKYHIER